MTSSTTKELKWAASYDDALAEAQRARRPIYVDFFNPD